MKIMFVDLMKIKIVECFTYPLGIGSVHLYKKILEIHSEIIKLA